ncbi:MAG: hypothetical protein GEU88_19850, partial [Solirubrobacterales bacterium]|nr:hypothetical protein [Solirubrobacterales bacterium]
MQRMIDLRRLIPRTIVGAVPLLVASAMLGLDPALAQKSGGKVQQVGDKTASLIESIVGPVLLVVIG